MSPSFDWNLSWHLPCPSELLILRVNYLAPQRSGVDLHGLVIRICTIKVLGQLPQPGSPARPQSVWPSSALLVLILLKQRCWSWCPNPEQNAMEASPSSRSWSLCLATDRSCRSSCNSISSLEKVHRGNPARHEQQKIYIFCLMCHRISKCACSAWTHSQPAEYFGGRLEGWAPLQIYTSSVHFHYREGVVISEPWLNLGKQVSHC